MNCLDTYFSFSLSLKKVACVVDGEVKNVGETWVSDDFCTTFTCSKDSGVSGVVAIRLQLHAGWDEGLYFYVCVDRRVRF